MDPKYGLGWSGSGETRFGVYGPAVGLGLGIVKELGLTGGEGGVIEWISELSWDPCWGFSV